jgi:hypothetical protein
MGRSTTWFSSHHVVTARPIISALCLPESPPEILDYFARLSFKDSSMRRSGAVRCKAVTIMLSDSVVSSQTLHGVFGGRAKRVRAWRSVRVQLALFVKYALLTPVN